MTKIVADRYSPKILLQNPTMWVSTDSPGPQQSSFGILSGLRTTWALRTPRVTEGHFVLSVPNPCNMGIYGLPWTPATKIWHFELTQFHLDTEDTEGKLAIGFVRFESLRPGFVDSRFESKGMDSWIPKFTLKRTKICHWILQVLDLLWNQ